MSGEQKVAVSPGPKRILVKPNEAESVSAGGIIIPETARKDATTTGIVVAVPEPYLVDGEPMAAVYPPGTQVIFGKFTGQEIDVPVSSEARDRRTQKLVVMYEKDVIAVVCQAEPEHEDSQHWYLTEGTSDRVTVGPRSL